MTYKIQVPTLRPEDAGFKAPLDILIPWPSVAAAVANAGIKEQVAFFEGFASEAYAWDTPLSFQMNQLGTKLSGKAKRVLEKIVEEQT